MNVILYENYIINITKVKINVKKCKINYSEAIFCI